MLTPFMLFTVDKIINVVDGFLYSMKVVSKLSYYDLLTIHNKICLHHIAYTFLKGQNLI